MRYLNWPERLAEVIEAARYRVFAYGGQDCCLFAADCVLAVTGIDYAAPFRGYYSRAAAYQIIAKHGSLTGLLTAVLDEPIEPAFAGRGDVVIAEIPIVEGEGESVGICLGAFCAFPQAVGLRFHPRSVARLAWRIS